MTSYFARRFPASSACGYTTSKGKSYCSSSQRVCPDGIDPPYWSASAMRGAFTACVPAGRVLTPSTVMPSSRAARSSAVSAEPLLAT
jgi:hypothetical protein